MPEQSFIGGGGGVFTYTLPLPPGIADQVTRGELLPVDGEPVSDAEPLGDAGLLMPAPTASKAAWVRYAVACGALDAGQAKALTREQLIAVLNPDLDTAAAFAREAG